MIYDLQKGSLLKRASAFLLDAILLVIIAVGFAFALSAILDYSKYSDIYSNGIERYSEQYGVDFERIVSQADFEALTDAERQNYEAAVNAMNEDEDILNALNAIVKLIVTLTSVSVFLAYAVMEFVLPLIFKNGQTVGKKVFGLGVMRTNGVKISVRALFVRTFLGKYVVETMVPVLVAMMIIFNAIGVMPSPGLFGPIIVLALLIAQIVLVSATKTNSMLHDMIADCVVVDLASQMIFDSDQARVDYITKKDAEEATKSPY